LSIQIKTGREKYMKKFIEEDKAPETFYIIAVEGSRRASDGKEEITIERIILRVLG